MIGQLLNNRYKITSPLREGGMGEVYIADDKQTNQQVAVKVMGIHLRSNDAMLERFRREAKTLSQLDHPNIVKFIDSFEHEGQFVIVMEYISGGSLHDLLKKGPLPVEQVQKIALGLCDALIRSHQLNIIHRDIKPENVLMDESGNPKLADFGVARLSEGTRMTQSGIKVGTALYMSPEAWEGKVLDEQTDIWSFGVMLFEMLTGKVPFDGDTEPAIMTKVFTTQPPNLKRLRSDIPKNLINIIMRMLARDKKKRYQTIRQVAVELEREIQKKITKTRSISDTTIQGKSYFNRNPKIATILVGGVAVIAFIAVVFPNMKNFLGGNQNGGSTPTAFLASTPSSENIPASTSSPVLEAAPTSTPIPEAISQQGADMVLLSAGSFGMGEDVVGGADESPLHTVTLDAFYMDKYEVTNTLYKLCVDDGICTLPGDTSKYDDPEYANHPVVFVDWYQAAAYCEWRGARLPTEAEWEYSASGTTYHTPSNDKSADTTEVGSYGNSESFFGLYDVNGNVWEWVNDWYSDTYYQVSPESNPQGPVSGEHKVMRGGSWAFTAFDTRPNNRQSNSPIVQLNTVGFRCAMDASESTNQTNETITSTPISLDILGTWVVYEYSCSSSSNLSSFEIKFLTDNSFVLETGVSGAWTVSSNEITFTVPRGLVYNPDETFSRDDAKYIGVVDGNNIKQGQILFSLSPNDRSKCWDAIYNE